MSQLHDCKDEPHKYIYAIMNHIQLFALISESTCLYYVPVKQALLRACVRNMDGMWILLSLSRIINMIPMVAGA